MSLPSMLTSSIESGVSDHSSLIAQVGSGIGAFTLALKAFNVIPEGQMGVKTRWGKTHHAHGKNIGELYGIVGPGRHLVVPFAHSIKPVSVRDKADNLRPVQVDSNDERQIVIESSVIWAVSTDGDNPYRALYHVEGSNSLTNAVVDTCTAGLRAVLEGKTVKQMKDGR